MQYYFILSRPSRLSPLCPMWILVPCLPPPFSSPTISGQPPSVIATPSSASSPPIPPPAFRSVEDSQMP